MEVCDIHGNMHSGPVRINGLFCPSDALIQFAEMVVGAYVPGVICPKGFKRPKSVFKAAELCIFGSQCESDERIPGVVTMK